MRITAVQIWNWKSFADTGIVELDNINVLVGRNNSGKSAFIRAIHQIQDGAAVGREDVRLDTAESTTTVHLSGDPLSIDAQRHFGISLPRPDNSAVMQVGIRDNGQESNPRLMVGDTNNGVNLIPDREPENFIYTYFSKRKVANFDPGVDMHKARKVASNLGNIVAKVDRLANPGYTRSKEYFDLCESVLGLPITAYPSNAGKQAGIQVGDFNTIPIESMGEGVSSQLGLITDLCMASGNLFLIEEPENDIHPEGLKKLLKVIVEKSATNQFIVSTHSNVVVKNLGAAPHSKLFSVALSDYEPNTVPTSTITPVENTPEARIDLLRQLGYELYDFDLNDGWLILEESSAQAIIRNYLIPWFAPRLARIQTVAAGGTGKVEPAFEDFRRLFLYAHLETYYGERAWVVIDGDDEGRKVVAELRNTYKTWTPEHFTTWRHANFEQYYPSRFAEQVAELLDLPHNAKRQPKRELLNSVKSWCDSHENEARAAFEESAQEVIAYLRKIDASLFGTS